MPTPQSRLPAAQALSDALDAITQRLNYLHHEVRLIADLACSGPPGHDGGNISLESLGTSLSAYADRLESVQQAVGDAYVMQRRIVHDAEAKQRKRADKQNVRRMKAVLASVLKEAV